MGIFQFFRRETDTDVGVLITTTAVAGISNSILLIVVNMAAGQVAHTAIEMQFFFIFLITFFLFVYAQHYSLTNTSVAIEKIVFRLRVRIADKLRHAELDYIEHNGIGKLYTQLVHNSDVLSEAAMELSTIIQAALLVVVSLFYLGYLSLIALALYCVFFGIAAYIFLHYNKEVSHKIREARKIDATFLDTLNHILTGFKELKFHQAKSNAVLADLRKIASTAETLKSDTKRRQSMLMVYARSIFYILLAVMVFVVPQFSQTYSEQIYALVATNLFIMGPIGMVVGMVPVLNRVNVAVNNLEILEAELDTVTSLQPKLVTTVEFNSLRLVNIGFDYQDEEGVSLFGVKNINLDLNPGEMLFIVGGNGSGKTSFLKLFTGLYYATSGHIEWNGKKLERRDYHRYRQLFSTIFTDFHLFNKLYGLNNVTVAQVEELLKEVELTHKTGYQAGQFTHTDLSTGQRKRLAFISAYLEDKPIYIFDELAADQDPQFRRRFYEEILPGLKAKGKTIVAVTHDDKYFGVADRVLKMDNGQLQAYTE